jgi:hypothetical protein
VPTDGGRATTIDLGVPVYVPMHRPGHPDQISFLGKDAEGTRGFFLVGRDGRDPRRMDLDAGFQSDENYLVNHDSYFQGQSWSSDGSRLLYYTLEPAPGSPAGDGYRVHLAKIGPNGEVLSDDILEYGPTLDDEFAAGWLPTEDSIIFQTVEGPEHRLWTAPPESGAPAKDLGVQGGDWISSNISPDGGEVIAGVPAISGAPPRVSIIDLASGRITPVDIGDDVSWQRVAP